MIQTQQQEGSMNQKQCQQQQTNSKQNKNNETKTILTTKQFKQTEHKQQKQ